MASGVAMQAAIQKNNLMKQPMVVSLKGGASGGEALMYMKSSEGDPNKILIAYSLIYMLPLAAKIPFNWRDLTPVSVIALDQFVLWDTAQIPYKTTKESLYNWSTFVGTDTPDDARAWRVFHNLYWKLDRERYGVILGLDVGAQEDIAGSGWDTWYTPQVVGRGKIGSVWLYGRVEYFADPSHIIVTADAPAAFRTWAGTTGVDLPVTKYAVWRLDARQFHSDASKDFLVVTTGLAIRFGGDLK